MDTEAFRSVSAVMGQVQEHETGLPLAGAAVSLASGPGGTEGIGTRVTNAEGEFYFKEVPPGSYRLLVTLLGYRTLEDTLQVQPGAELELTLPLSISPIELEPIVVVAEAREDPFLQDFQRRQRAFSGTFLEREDIEELHPLVFTDLMRRVPGARVIPAYPYGNTVRLRGNCRPVLWVDGVRLTTEMGMDQLLTPMDVEAVEVYHSSWFPVEFGSNSCGAIVVWTRRGEPSPPREGFWRRLALGGGFLLLAFIATR